MFQSRDPSEESSPPRPPESSPLIAARTDECAIDDDASDWEDYAQDTGELSGDEKLAFQRIDSQGNLHKSRSLITLGLSSRSDQGHRLGACSLTDSRSFATPPRSSDHAPLEMRRARRVPTGMPISKTFRSSARHITNNTHTVPYQAVLSPRSTRRNMLGSELNGPLRRHLLWERSQTSLATNHCQRHTPRSVGDLRLSSLRPYMKKEEDEASNKSWKQYLDEEANTGYHSRGW